MTLAEYMDKYDLLDREFAEEIGTHRPQVTIWRNGRVTPTFENMVRIFEATNGEVTPNDFLPPDLIKRRRRAA